MKLLLHAILVALIAPSASFGYAQQTPPPTTQREIDAAIDRGAILLLGVYAGRGDNEQLAAQECVGQTALSLYTLLKAGVPKDDPTVRRILACVLKRRIDRTYDATCAILALSAHEPIDDRRWIEDLARKLIAWQLEGGDWGYPGGFGDLSNTQYAALGLWVATLDGVAIDANVWVKLAGAVLRYQSDGGGFGYNAPAGHGDGGTGSMTAAGIGTLAICETQLRAAGECSLNLAIQISVARARGLEWLARNFSITTNPNAGSWLYYYLYGLERVGALSGVARLGGHDWYDEGAAFLVARQTPRGSWENGSDLSTTCFAILFLKRATSARRTPITGERVASADSDSPLRIASEGNGVVRVWISAWNKQLAHELEWVGERGSGPRVMRVEYMADDKLCAVELGDPARVAMNVSFSATHIFDSVGKHRLKARVFVLAPGEKPGSELTFESQSLEVDIVRAQPRWADELRLDLGPNLALDPKAKVKASSHVKAKEAPMGLEFGPEAVIDGSGATPWLADAKDAERSLTISFEASPVCNVIRISPAVLPAMGANYLSRPIELEIEINGKNKQRLAMDPDPLHPMRLELEHKTTIKRLDIRILSSAPSAACPLVGIGEVELFLRKD